MIDLNIENDLVPFLGKDEKLIWTGMPKTGIVFRKEEIFFLPYSLLLAGFTFYFFIRIVSTHAPFLVNLIVILFALFILFTTIGRFFIDAKRRANTVYGITQNRIIIRSGVFKIRMKSFYIGALSDISISQKEDDTGTISFYRKDPFSISFGYSYSTWGSTMQLTNLPGMKQTQQLEFIANVRAVYELLVGVYDKQPHEVA